MITTPEGIIAFGYWEGMPYGEATDTYEDMLKLKNKLSKQTIIDYISKLDLAVACVEEMIDPDTGERLLCGIYVDDEFVFPSEFFHFYKKTDVGIPYEYEERIKSKLNIK